MKEAMLRATEDDQLSAQVGQLSSEISRLSLEIDRLSPGEAELLDLKDNYARMGLENEGLIARVQRLSFEVKERAEMCEELQKKYDSLYRVADGVDTERMELSAENASLKDRVRGLEKDLELMSELSKPTYSQGKITGCKMVVAICDKEFSELVRIKGDERDIWRPK